MAFTTEQHGDITAISVSGNLDSMTVPEFQEILNTVREAGQTRIVVDLGEVDYMSSGGLRAMLTARNAGCDLRLSRAGDRVQQVLELTGTDQLFSIYGNLMDAIGSFGNTQGEGMDYTTEKQGDVTVVALTGNMDSLTSGGIESSLLEMVQGGTANMVVDMSGVAFMSSAGLRTLLAVSKAARKAGGDMRLVEGPDGIQKVIKMAGFDNIFKSYGDADTAVSSFE